MNEGEEPQTPWENAGLPQKVVDAMRSADVEFVEELCDANDTNRKELQGPPFGLSWGNANKVVTFVKKHKKRAVVRTRKAKLAAKVEAKKCKITSKGSGKHEVKVRPGPEEVFFTPRSKPHKELIVFCKRVIETSKCKRQRVRTCMFPHFKLFISFVGC